MDIKELTELLVQSVESNRGKYVPWWEDDFENCMYRYDLFSKEDIHNVEECVKACDKSQLFEPVGSLGFTLLHHLVWLNFYSMVENLWDNPSEKPAFEEINCTDGKGKDITPLMLACSRGNLAMAKLLMTYGADFTLCDWRGRNVYHYLASPSIKGMTNYYRCLENGVLQREAIAGLFEEGINKQDEEGMTPFVLMLHESNANYSWALTDIFLEKGAQTDYRDENGNTLLHTAIYNHHMTAALRLMENTDMVNQENKEGKTPMQIAIDYRNEGLCMALGDHGAKEPWEKSRMPLNELSRITSNAFSQFSSQERDNISIALYLAGKLIRQVDPDDDDDMKCVEGILYSALLNDEKCRVLDLCKEAGIDFTTPVFFGGSVTCLRDCCLGGNYGVKTIKKLIELGVDMNEAIIQGRTPANIVASLRKRNMLSGQKDDYFEKAAVFFTKESMEQVDNMGTTAIHQAVKNNHAEMLQVMIEKGVDVNLAEDAPAEAGNTPLHTGCIYGSAECVKILEDCGGDDAIQNVNGETPAHHAVMKKKFGGDLDAKQRANVLKELKNLDIARNDGKTPIMLLQYRDINTNMDLLPIFLEKGADVNHADNDGNTPLTLNAYNQCYKGVVKELVRSGANVNASDNRGNTALHYALQYGSQETARFLIKKGADYNYANNQEITPVQLAVEKGYDSVLELMSDIT